MSSFAHRPRFASPPLLALPLPPLHPHRARRRDQRDPARRAGPLPARSSAPSRPSPREQCFLYTELVHTMTEIAGKQMLDGDIDHASATLKRVEHYAQLIHMGLANDTKRLKNAEMLMHHTTHRLGDYMRMPPPATIAKPSRPPSSSSTRSRTSSSPRSSNTDP